MKSIELKCRLCSEAFSVSPSVIRSGRGSYCSRRCLGMSKRRHYGPSIDVTPELMARFRAKFVVDPDTGCWIWTSFGNRKGYGWIWACGRNRLAHRVSYELHVGAIPGGLHVLHSCDRPSCVNPKHLSVGTMSENISDSVRKRRHGAVTHPERVPHGERSGVSKLKFDDVSAIRVMAADGIARADIAAKFGVSRSSINQIVRGVTWRQPPPGRVEVVTVVPGNRCAYCGCAVVRGAPIGSLHGATLDHIVPLSRGGSSDPSNIVTACRSCNSRKQDRTPAEAGMAIRMESA